MSANEKELREARKAERKERKTAAAAETITAAAEKEPLNMNPKQTTDLPSRIHPPLHSTAKSN